MRIVLRVAFQPDLPPYQFIDSQGKPVGAHIDIFDSMARRQNIVTEYVAMQTNTACMEALTSGKVDVVLGIRSNARHANNVVLTSAISQSQVCLMAPADIAMDIRKRLDTGYFQSAFEKGLIDYSTLMNHRNLYSVVVANQRETFDLLISKRVDMAIGVKNSLVYQIQRSRLEQDYTITNNYLLPVEYVMALRSGDKTLLHQLERGISQIRMSGQYEQIHDRWIQPEVLTFQELARKASDVFVTICCGAVVIFLVNLSVSILLKRRVNLRTKELRQVNTLLNRQIIEIHNTNELRDQIVESHPHGIVVFDTDFKVTACNTNACHIFGLSEPPLGRSVFTVSLLAPLLERKKDQWFEPTAVFDNEDLIGRDENVETAIYRCDIRRLVHRAGGMRGIILSIKNVTVERRKNEIFYERERVRALHQMVVGITHEIRNPLTSIKTFVALIPAKKNSPKFQEEMARYLPAELDRISGMVSHLMDYAKPQTQVRQPVLADEIITSCNSLMRYSISPGIVLEAETEEGLVIEANPSQLTQIMINLILNGAEAMEEKVSGLSPGQRLRIRLCARSEGDEVVITVRDEGCGMGEPALQRACEPYFSTKPNGTGLGLAISRQYVEENGGALSIRSKENEYTEVTLRFRRYRL